MPKIITDDIKYKIILFFYLGYTRDDIAKKLDIGQGTVSKYIDEFKKEIGSKTFDAIKKHGRIYLESGTAPGNALVGLRLFNMLTLHDVDEKVIDKLLCDCFEILGCKEDVPALLALAAECKKTMDSTGMSPSQLEEKHKMIKSEVPILEQKKLCLEQEIKQLEGTLQCKIQESKVTLPKLDQYDTDKQQLSEAGLSISDLAKYSKGLNEFSRLGFDAKKTLGYISEIEDLEKKITSLKNEKSLLQKNVQKEESELKTIKDKLYAKRKILQSAKKVTSIIEDFHKSGQDPSIMVQWNHMIKQSGSTVKEFTRGIDEYGSLQKYLRTIGGEIILLKKKESKIQASIKSDSEKLNQTIQNLDMADILLDEKIRLIESVVKKLEATDVLQKVFDNTATAYDLFVACTLLIPSIKKCMKNNSVNSDSIDTQLDDTLNQLGKVLLPIAN